MKELFNTLDTVVLCALALSILAPLIFMVFGWMKPSDVRKYVNELKPVYFMFVLYGLVRLCL